MPFSLLCSACLTAADWNHYLPTESSTWYLSSVSSLQHQLPVLLPIPAHSALLCPSNSLIPSVWLPGQELWIYSWLPSCHFRFILDYTLITLDLFLSTLLSLPHVHFISKSCWIYTQTLSDIQSLHLSSAIITLVNMTTSLFPAIFLLPLLAALPLPNVHCQITTRRLVRYQVVYTLCTNTFLKMTHLICNSIDT